MRLILLALVFVANSYAQTSPFPASLDSNATLGVPAGNVSSTPTSPMLAAAVVAIETKLHAELVSVKDFGAIGDGAANDTAAIARAIAASHAYYTPATASYGGSLYFPPGTYLTDPITNMLGDDHWFGAGINKTFLKSRTGGDVISVNANNVVRTHLHDFSIVGTGTGTGRGISYITSAATSSMHWHDINFIAIGGTCIYLPLAFSWEMSNIEMSCGNGGTGNGFDVEASNTGNIHDSYVYSVGINGVGYRLHSGYFILTNTNGLNSGVNASWGVFGDVAGEDPSPQYARVVLNEVNIEGFSSTGVRVKSGSCLASVAGGKMEGGATGSPRLGFTFDANSGCTGTFTHMVIGNDAANPAMWANGQAIHFTGVMPFVNLGGGLSGGGSNVLTAWNDSGARVVAVPNLTVNYDGNYSYSIDLNRVTLASVSRFCLGEANPMVTPICQLYGSAAPSTGAHLRGEIVWNDRAAAGGSVGWVCTAAGTPGTWAAFGGPIGPGGTGNGVAVQDVKVIANGVNGCASANNCWEVNGVPGPALAAGTSQSGIYFPSPRGAGIYVRDVRIKSIVACTGTTTAALGVSTSAGYVYVAAAAYDIQAAVADANLWPKAGQSLVNTGAASDANTTIGAVVSTTGGNVNALNAGCEFKIWIDYWMAN